MGARAAGGWATASGTAARVAEERSTMTARSARMCQAGPPGGRNCIRLPVPLSSGDRPGAGSRREVVMPRRRSVLAVLALGWIALGGSAGTGTPGEPSPLAGLPPWMRLLLPWGQRPEWDRDGAAPPLHGEGVRRRLPPRRRDGRCHAAHHALLPRRLRPRPGAPNGDYLLTGTRDFEAKDPWKDRHRLEMFVLDKSLAKPAGAPRRVVRRGAGCLAHADARLHGRAPGQREIVRGRHRLRGTARPSLAGQAARALVRRPAADASGSRPQDFRPPDEKELLFSSYSGTRRGAVLLLGRLRDRPR